MLSSNRSGLKIIPLTLDIYQAVLKIELRNLRQYNTTHLLIYFTAKTIKLLIRKLKNLTFITWICLLLLPLLLNPSI